MDMETQRDKKAEAMERKHHIGSRHSVPYESLLSLFTEDEIEVSQILLDLLTLIPQSDAARNRSSLSWGVKRKRSALNSSPSPSGVCAPPSSPCPQGLSQVDNGKDGTTEAKVVATSPATPLSFSPSESDEKPKRRHGRKFKKKSREEWLETINALIQCRESLQREVEIVRNYYRQLKTQNSELKNMKQALIARSYLRKDEPISEINNSLNLGLQVRQASAMARPEQEEHYPLPMAAHQRHFMIDPTAYCSLMSDKFQYPLTHRVSGGGGGLGVVNHVGPLGGCIPDLNVYAEETSQVDYLPPLDLSRVLAENRAKAAGARKQRMLKIKEMRRASSVATVKTIRFR